MSAKAIQLKGLGPINRKLRSLEAKVAKKVIRQSMRQALKPVQTEAKAEAPKDGGALAKAIKIRSGGRGRKGAIILRIVITKDSFPGIFYAAFRDLGTKRMKADPFMQRTVKSERSGAIRRARDLILAGINREARS